MTPRRRRSRAPCWPILILCFYAWAGPGPAAVRAGIVVVPAGSDAAANCDALIAAIDGITAASQNDAHQVRLEPGLYRCDGKTVVMKAWVDIVGSGIETTTLEGSGRHDGLALANVLIRGADHAELRDLMVEMDTPTATSVGIFVYEAETRVDNVDVLVKNGGAAFDCTAVLLRADSGEAPLIPWRPILRNGFFDARACRNTYGVVVRGAISPQVRRSYLMATNAALGVAEGNENIGLLFDGTDFLKNSNSIRLRDVEIGAYGLAGDNARCYGVGFRDVVHIWKLEFYQNRIAADRCTNGNVGVGVANPQTAKHNLYFYESQLKAAKGEEPLDDVGILAQGNKVFVELYGGSVRSQGPAGRAVDGASIKLGGAHLDSAGVDGDVTCAGVYDGGFNFFAGTCP